MGSFLAKYNKRSCKRLRTEVGEGLNSLGVSAIIESKLYVTFYSINGSKKLNSEAAKKKERL